MFEIHFSPSHKGLAFSLVAFTAGIGLWTTIGSFPVPDSHDTAASKVAECQDAADVMASLDRNRNGVSLTCNAEKLSAEKAR